MTLAAFLLSALALAEPARSAVDSAPVQAARAYLYALYARDSAAYREAILPVPGAESMLGARTRSDSEKVALRREAATFVPGSWTVRFEGRPVAIGATAPIGARAILPSSFRGAVFQIPVERTAAGWKVDVRYWLEMLRQQREPVRDDDPGVAAKRFLLALFSGPPEVLEKLSSKPVRGGDWVVSDLPGGDLDQILSLIVEMPVVAARPGERLQLPSGRRVVQGEDPSRTLMIGLLGRVEIPFSLVRRGESWKVDPERYSDFLAQAGVL